MLIVPTSTHDMLTESSWFRDSWLFERNILRPERCKRLESGHEDVDIFLAVLGADSPLVLPLDPYIPVLEVDWKHLLYHSIRMVGELPIIVHCRARIILYENASFVA